MNNRKGMIIYLYTFGAYSTMVLFRNDGLDNQNFPDYDIRF